MALQLAQRPSIPRGLRMELLGDGTDTLAFFRSFFCRNVAPRWSSGFYSCCLLQISLSLCRDRLGSSRLRSVFGLYGMGRIGLIAFCYRRW